MSCTPMPGPQCKQSIYYRCLATLRIVLLSGHINAFSDSKWLLEFNTHILLKRMSAMIADRIIEYSTVIGLAKC